MGVGEGADRLRDGGKEKTEGQRDGETERLSTGPVFGRRDKN